MGILGPKVTLRINSHGPYQPNDVIEGVVIVENSSEFQVQNLDVMLRCSEIGHTHYYDSYGLQTRRREIYNTNRVYSYRQTLFPTHESQAGHEPPIFFGSRIPKPSNSWNSRYTKRYTVPGGTHTFGFALQVPEGYPSTVVVSISNAVHWIVSAKMFKGGSFSVAREVHEEVPVYRGGTIGFVPHAVTANSEIRQVKVYLEGYQNATKSASGFFKNLGNSEFKKDERIVVTLFVPNIGLMQSPHPAHLRLALDCSTIDHILVKQVVLRLKRKVRNTLRERPRMSGMSDDHHDTFRAELTIYSRSIQLPCAEALKEINDDLDKLQIAGMHTDSYISQLFEISYKLVAEITVASREKPSSTDKLRISVPVIVQSPLVSVVHIEANAKQGFVPIGQPPVASVAAPEAEDALPAYAPPEKPAASETTFSDTKDST